MLDLFDRVMMDRSVSGAVERAVSLCGLVCGVRTTVDFMCPGRFFVDVATDAPLFDYEKQMVREIIEGCRYPGALVAVRFGWAKGGLRSSSWWSLPVMNVNVNNSQ